MRTFAEIVVSHPRVVLCGYPRAGKSSLAMTAIGCGHVLSTDAWIDLDWEAVPAACIEALAACGARWVLEGVRAPWCLREGLAADAAVWLAGSRVELEAGQLAIGKAAESVFEAWAESVEIPIYRL